MSRRNPPDNSASVSLFPFLAVLLCTMGALLVVLVAVSRSARDSVIHQANTRHLVSPETDPAAQAELERVNEYAEHLKRVRDEAEKKVREDQLRLGQLESHMRDLQAELKKLVLAAAELDALEVEHYDDQKQAEREIARLKGLIEQSETAIAALKQSTAPRKRSYALVPYEGPNGTFRRPIYIECREEGLVLQPEGVVITREDLQPPQGSANALASVLRAARDHYIEANPDEGKSRDTEPYPMILIRPDGAELMALARKAVEAGDFDFGFEPVESDWKIDFGAPNPKLALAEEQALEQARIRQQVLAQAAPRAYRDTDLAAARRFEPEPELSDDYAFVGQRRRGSSGSSHARAGGSAEGGPGGNGNAGGRYGEGASAGGGAAGTQSAGAGPAGGDQPGGVAGAPAGQGGSAGGTSAQPTGGQFGAAGAANGSGNGGNAGGGGGGQQVSSGGSSQMASAGDDASSMQASPQRMNEWDANMQARGSGSQSGDAETPGSPSFSKSFDDRMKTQAKDLQFERKVKNSVPVRRSIHVVVRADHVAIVPDNVKWYEATTGNSIPFKRDTVETFDQFVAAVHKEIDGWGIAGDGLYWRPVLEIQVGPDGVQRAEDLKRLLERSDLEIKPTATANQATQGAPHATR